MDDARPKMCLSPSPPPPTPKAIFSSNLSFGYKCSSDHLSAHNSGYHCQDYNSNSIIFTKELANMQRREEVNNVSDTKIDEETTSDYKQWLHAMKLVARLPGGIPPEFRRKLWLSLADKYLKSKNVNWDKEEEKCFCEKWGEDDEELGIQIVKDLHRTGSTLCTGPAGDLNQAKLKRILLGYARYNPEVGYCQGFNMLGALILQVMDKHESESIKVMIYLVEGILPTGYFCGSMGGLQADMAVFRELMQTKLPRLAKHLQKLQGPIENAYEPPLTNVFTMQWFLTMFCTCLPMSCVLRVWDLVLIEGSDVLLRTALALWSLLEERVLSARSADDFYGKMGSFSSELLNGHLVDSNGLIEKVVQLGPIIDIEKLRNKHLYNVAPIDREQGLQLYFDDDEPDIDEDSRLAVATVWGIPWGRRGSQGQSNNNVPKQALENKDRIALDISLLKKQYDKLRERQKQAQIILTTACSTASRQSAVTAPLPVNQLLSGRSAIITNRGRRSRPPSGAIPPARKPSLPAVLHEKSVNMQLKRGETIHWRDTKDTRDRRDSLTWKEIKAERAAMISSGSIDGLKSQKLRSGRLGKSDSSSYSEESDDNEDKGREDASSTDTSLCDEDLQLMMKDKKQGEHVELKDKPISKSVNKSKKTTHKHRKQTSNFKDMREKTRPKSWAPSNTEIPFVLMTTESPNNSADETPELFTFKPTENKILSDEKGVVAEEPQPKWNAKVFSPSFEELVMSKKDTTPQFESTSTKENMPSLGTPTPTGGNKDKGTNMETFDIGSEGVTNEYFERVNSTERPTKLDLLYSLNDDENTRDYFKSEDKSVNQNQLSNSKNINRMDLLVDYSEKSSVACIEEAKTEISTIQSIDTTSPKPLKHDYIDLPIDTVLKKPKTLAEKRRDPRRLTLTRSSTMDIEKRFEMLEKRLSMEAYSHYKKFPDEVELSSGSKETSQERLNGKFNKASKVYQSNGRNHASASENLPTENVSLDRKIPSTADLEQRFENIQQQLVKERNKMTNSPNDSENVDSKPNLSTSSDNNIARSSQSDKTNKQLEKHDQIENRKKAEGEEMVSAQARFKEESSAYEKVGEGNNTHHADGTIVTGDHASENTVSETTQLQSEKKPPDGQKNKSNDEIKTNVDQTDSDENCNRNSSEVVEETDTSEEKCKTTKEAKETPERTSPPSTEELEKRFSALEKQMSCAKIDSNGMQPSAESKTMPDKLKDISDKTEEKPVQDTESYHEKFNKTEVRASNSMVAKDPKTSLAKFNETSEKMTARRLSEPPSTEDLEKRYEVLKRRMSSRNFETRPLRNATISNERQQPTESPASSSKKDIIISSSAKHSPPSIENLEERYEKLQNNNEPKTAIAARSVPSAENLEKRFEKLQNKKEPMSPPSAENLEKRFEKLQGEKDTEHESVKSNQMNSRKSNDDKAETSGEKNADERGSTAEEVEEVDVVSEKKEAGNILAKNVNKIKIKLIEELQAKIKNHAVNTDVDRSIEKKIAVIEELKSKIDTKSDNVLRPTQVSPRRHPNSQSSLLPSLSFNDETLESHATSAHCKSGKDEPNSTAKRKLVRRFSDLPSRADLENRLQFLEEQLSKTLCMQRRSSDSEVASKRRFNQKPPLTNVPLSANLEYRVRELEKHLSDNRTFSMDVDCTKTHEKSEPDIEISQVGLAADAAGVTGKELVRYSSHGEVGETEHQNPINISISIQMTLNKDDISHKKSTDASKTDDLDRRLQFLEQQMKTTREQDALKNATDNTKESSTTKNQIKIGKEVENAERTEKATEDVEQKSNVKHRDESPQKHDQDINQDNNEGREEPVVAKTYENVQSKNISEESKGSGIDLSANDCSGEQETASQFTKTNREREREPKELESADPAQLKTTDKPQENANGQKVPVVSKEKNVVENQEQKIVEKTKSEGEPSTAIIPSKSSAIADNLEEDKCPTDSLQPQLQQAAEAQANGMKDTQEGIPLNEQLRPQVEEFTEKKVSANDEKDPKCENKGNTEIEKFIGANACSQIVPVEVNKKTLVLLLDNEPKAVKVRRLTRANTEELEGLFQALEKQLSDRGQQKTSQKETKKTSPEMCPNDVVASQAMTALAKEIEEFSKPDTNKTEPSVKPPQVKNKGKEEEFENEKVTQVKHKKQQEEFDWGSDPIKYHLKKRTVYLPSTKELEARFRSLERQIMLLEHVEKIDVEQRLLEIERKIKLQYSLSHEKDLNKFLELCDGKEPDDLPKPLEHHQEARSNCAEVQFEQKCCMKHASPGQLKEPMPVSNKHECHYRSLDLKRSKPKPNLKKEPIHPLEMLLDPSPDDSEIPTTGELEHRMRIMEENRYTPSPPSRKSRSVSPPNKEMKTKAYTHTHAEKFTASPTERGLPTAEELEARLEALEKEHCFNFQMQKNFQKFNQKLKDVVSPSLSFDEFKTSTKSCDSEPSALQACSTQTHTKAANAVSPKTIRFCEKEQFSSQKDGESLRSTLAIKGSQQPPGVHEDLGVMGIRLMRETSPLRRKGTYTGIPLRTGENINDQLTSIQNTIKSIDNLCEEKPYRKERCQQYIDALFSGSTHFTHKRTSLEDLTSRDISRATSREIGPSIRISDHSPAFSRSMGSADSIQSSSPLRSSSPLQYRSNRDLRREPSPRRRRDEDREEHESRLPTTKRKVA